MIRKTRIIEELVVRTNFSDGGIWTKSFGLQSQAEAQEYAIAQFDQLGVDEVAIFTERTRISEIPIKTWSHR